jgi:hypothetical protein
LCEYPSATPVRFGPSFFKKVDLTTPFNTAAAIDTFVHNTVSEYLTFNLHEDIASGKFVIDRTQLAYIRKLDGKTVAFYAA